LQTNKLKIGTRGSPLALWQANHVRDLIAASNDFPLSDIELEIFKTAGDRIQDQALRDFGGKGLFTKEIEDALTDGQIDLAVHSMKDVQTELPQGLTIPCILPREDIRDAFISLTAKSLEDLPEGSKVGTSSLRRQAQVLRLRPDLTVVTYRGNVETRLQKLKDGVADATFLAAAGLKRLGYEKHITALIEPSKMLPAVAQGAIGIEIRSNDTASAQLIAPLNDPATNLKVTTERAFLKALDGSCRTPIAGLASRLTPKLAFPPKSSSGGQTWPRCSYSAPGGNLQSICCSINQLVTTAPHTPAAPSCSYLSTPHLNPSSKRSSIGSPQI